MTLIGAAIRIKITILQVVNLRREDIPEVADKTQKSMVTVHTI
jgi:hypothetical protein